MTALEMLISAREKAGLRVKHLAAEAGMNPGFVSDIFHGNRRISLDAAVKLCPVLGLKPLEVLYQQTRDELSEKGLMKFVDGDKTGTTLHSEAA